MSMPLIVKVGLAALIAVSVSAAAASKPPKELKPGLTGLVLGASVVGYAVAAGLLLTGSAAAGAEWGGRRPGPAGQTRGSDASA